MSKKWSKHRVLYFAETRI